MAKGALIFALVVGLLFAVVLSLAAGAGAEQRQATGFGSGGPGAGELQQPGGIAINAEGTRIFIADTDNERIDEFAASAGSGGEFRRAWGWGVADGRPELQTCTTECEKGLAGTGPGQLNEPVGVAVDAAGDVYSVNRGRQDGRVQKFGTAGEAVSYEGALPAGYEGTAGATVGFTYPLPATNDIAIGSDGTIYVADDSAAEGPRVIAFDPTTGTSEPIPVAVGRITAIGAAPGGTLYVGGQSGELAVLDGGVEAARYELGLAEITAISYDERSGNLIVEPADFSQAEGTAFLNLREVSPEGEVLANIPVEGVRGPEGSQPAPFGLVVDPTLQIEGGVKYNPGAIFLASPYANSVYDSRVRVLAERAAGPPQIFQEGPEVEPSGTEAANVSIGVNAEGIDTKVYFEYGTTTAYGSTVPAPPGTDIGSGFLELPIRAQLTGLRPGTIYHVAAVAANSAGSIVSGDTTFSTFASEASFLLPDERSWEQVTTEKGTGVIALGQVSAPKFAAPDGNAISFSDDNVLPGSEAGVLSTSYTAFRSPSGWTTKGISLPTVSTAIQTGDTTELIAQDLERSVGRTVRDLIGDAPPGSNLYLRDSRTGAVTLLTPGASGASGRSFGHVSGSADLSRIFFTSNVRLTPDTPEGAENSLFEWNAGTLHNVGILPGASTPGTTNIEFQNTNTPPPGIVSEDGSRIFFNAEPGPGLASQLFGRIDSDRTVSVSAPQTSEPEEEAARQRATFQGASDDGRYVFFTTSAELTDDANTGEVPVNGEGEPELREAPNLYRYDVDTGQLIDLSVDTDSTDPADVERGANVQEVLTAADGGSAYFTAFGKLADGATSGERNLYRWSQAAGVQYVTTLPGDSFSRNAARTSDDGSVLAFYTNVPLDPRYPTYRRNEIYVFSASAGTSACVTCAHSPSFPAEERLTAGPNVLSSDGSRLFFQTPAPLVASDTNGKTDVYEWEAGAVHLISSGTARENSELIDASPSGDDVFFVTTSRLATTDDDNQSDVYDARVHGGFPTAPQPAGPCEAEGCRPAAEAAPATPVAGSRSFNGPPDRKRKRHRKKHPRRVKKKHHTAHRKHVKHRGSRTQAAVGKHG